MKKKLFASLPFVMFIGINLISFILLFYFYKNKFSNFVIFKMLFFILLVWVPLLFSKLVNIKFPKVIYQLYYFTIITDILFGNIFLFNGIIGFYNYLVLFIQGGIFYIIGLWVIKYFDDYGYLSFKLITYFSLFFSITLSSFKKILFFTFDKLFIEDYQGSLFDLLIAIIGSIFLLALTIIDNKYNNQKYFRKLDIFFQK